MTEEHPKKKQKTFVPRASSQKCQKAAVGLPLMIHWAIPQPLARLIDLITPRRSPAHFCLALEASTQSGPERASGEEKKTHFCII